jgi:hypothetical protein
MEYLERIYEHSDVRFTGHNTTKTKHRPLYPILSKFNPVRIDTDYFFDEIWGSQGGEDVEVRLLGCNAVRVGLLSTYSALKKETVSFYER